MKCWFKCLAFALTLNMIASLAYSDESQTTNTKPPIDTQDVVQTKEDKEQLKPADTKPPIETQDVVQAKEDKEQLKPADTKPPIETHQDVVQTKEDKEQLKPADKPPYFPIDEPVEEDYGESRFWDEFVNMLFTLGILIALLFGASWLMRRLTSSRVQYANVTSQIKILEQRNLSPKTALYLVEIGDQHVLIADFQTGVAKILEIKKSDAAESFSALIDDDKPKP